MIPIVFFHIGEQDYFQSAINIASKKNKIIVIGNQTETFKNKNTNISFFDYKNFYEGVDEFRIKYKHLHSGGIEMQVICYIRWFVIKNLIEKLNIDVFFHADSDLAVLVDVEQYYNKLGNPKLALSTQEYQDNFRFVASGHCSYFTKDSIKELCDFFIESYDENSETYKMLLKKYEWHKITGTGGGVCDMTQLYLYSLTQETMSLTRIYDDSCFDDNINSPENYLKNEYKTENNLKKILFKDNEFYFENIEGKIIKTNSIHCQGQSKRILQKIEEMIK